MEAPLPDFHNRLTLNAAGRLIDLSVPKIMGILNITPDSFYDGGRYGGIGAVVERAGQMLEEGAAFLDVGGHSSRPRASEIAENEEIDRVLPVIEELVKAFPGSIISIDTFRSGVARQAIAAGASIVNDISAGLLDENMLPAVAESNVPYIMMHMRGNPQTMAGLTHYDDLVKEVLFYFSQRISAARDFGINDIIVDPGFGFAKTIEQNYKLLRHLDMFPLFTGLPVMAGLSRKSMASRALGISPADALNATTALNTLALSKGAKILRVHDVKEAMEAVRVYEMTAGCDAAGFTGDDTARHAKS
jgi:dihydropteroate synthase